MTGRIAGSWMYNPLVLGVLPLVLFCVGVEFVQPGAQPASKARPLLLWILLASILLFGVLRNLPGFGYLAPGGEQSWHTAPSL